MKKLFIFCALLASIAVMTSCQKEQGVVTLKAVIGQDTKAYFGGTNDPQNRPNLPYWDDDDELFIKGLSFSGSYGLTNPNPGETLTTFATITNVPASDVYCAIYPSRIVDVMGTPSATGTTASIYYDPHQLYIWDNDNQRQRVNMPMGAVTTNETLIFKNLCSILRLNVTNALATNTNFENVDFDVMRLTAQSFGAYLAGFGDVILYEDDDPAINMNSLHHESSDNVLSVYDPNHQSMGTIYLSNTNNNPTSKSFDIIVPPFTASSLTLEVELYKHNSGTPLGYYAYTFDNPVSVGRNEIVTIDLAVDRYDTYDYAYLESGPDFNTDIRRIINSNITTIKFNYFPGGLTDAGISIANEWDENTTPSGWVELQASNSPHKIYGYISPTDPEVLEINSFASSIYAHSNCSTMFKNLSDVINIGWTETVLFVTEDVTDMSYMFAGCTDLSILSSINSFNTTNVTNMAHMFDGCSSLGQLDLSSLHTHNLRSNGMVAMFNGCSNLGELNLSSFTSEQITDMTDLFNGCSNMLDLYINQFVISNNTTLTNMCTGLASGRSPYWRCAIHCTDNVKPTLLSQDENNHYITGIDRTKVCFPNQGENREGQTTK